MPAYFASAGLTLHHGDCRSVLAGLAPGSVDLVLTDPPWNLGLDYGRHRDDLPTDRYDAWLAGILARCAELGARRAVYLPGRHNLDRVDAVLQPSGMVCSAVLRWHRGLDWEPVVVAQVPGAPAVPAGPARGFFALRPPPDAESGHPCPKPLALITWLLRAWGWHGATVLDPFAGTGTSLLAARRLGLWGTGIEQEERFCAAAAARLGGAA